MKVGGDVNGFESSGSSVRELADSYSSVSFSS